MNDDGRTHLPPLALGAVVNDRYEIRQSLGKGGMGEVFLAYDRTAQQAVALKIVREEARMPGDEKRSGKSSFSRGRSVIPTFAASTTSRPAIRLHSRDGVHHRPNPSLPYSSKKAQGGYTADEFRRIAGTSRRASLPSTRRPRPRGPQTGQRHGDNEFRRLARQGDGPRLRVRQGASPHVGAPAGAPPDGGTPNYMSPERIRSGGASPEDDVYALGLTLLEMWTCRVPEPGYNPAHAAAATDHVRCPGRAERR